MSGKSVLHRHVEWWCLVVCPLVSRGTFGPLCDSGCVLTEEVDTWWCWKSGDVVSMYLPLSLLCMFFGLAEITGLSGGKSYMTSQIAWLRKLDCSPLSHIPHHKMRPPQTLFGQSHFDLHQTYVGCPRGALTIHVRLQYGVCKSIKH